MSKSKTILLLVGLLLAWPSTGYTGAITFGIFHEFSFSDAGVAATGCFPADPAGGFCISSSGTPTDFLDAPPWTFNAAAGAVLTVVDAFENTDRFQVFDFGGSLGLTSQPAGTLIDCGDDPVVCLATAGMSQGVFALGPGAHSITITPTLAGLFGGAAYLRVEGAAAAVPEPMSGTVLLLGAGFVALTSYRRRAR